MGSPSPTTTCSKRSDLSELSERREKYIVILLGKERKIELCPYDMSYLQNLYFV